MTQRSILAAALLASSLLTVVSAANAQAWKSRSIYQLITDRFAPVSDDAPARTDPIPTTCDPALQTWCGGTWLSIIDKLDYIQGMGFDAIWISPVSQNIDVYTPYNYAYHGYWVDNPTVLNPRFGSSDDLLALSNALHARDMYLMVDIVVNNIPSLNVNVSTNATALVEDLSFWTEPEYFHPFCWIDYSNQTSVEYCWLGDDNVALMDVNTENEYVISTLESWVSQLVSNYSIDGLRIDAAKHIPGTFWPGFCGAAGVFCIGEVYTDDIGFAATFQTENYMDAVLGYPLYYGLVDGFSAPMGNMSGFIDFATSVLDQFPNPGVLGNFLENHDLPRWRNTTADPQLAYNAMVVQFLFEGIPIAYYGQEQDFSNGAADPYNRAALWPSDYSNTTTYQRMGRLNQIRSALISTNITFEGTSYLDATSKILSQSAYDVAFRKGPIIMSVTNRGSPSQEATFGISNVSIPSQTAMVDLLSCTQFTVGSGETLLVSYAASGSGGRPYVWVTQTDATILGLCDSTTVGVYTPSNTTSSAAWPTASSPRSSLSLISLIAVVLAALF